ncbi:unnamed protein product [Heligmosomoides polygyrus]|uniref:G_PROTEIN_RECEP_F1_2 domain-containing protein n=1 Tax=Heligmosomoides polygyrus TaxID=6339 RepID=A0A3P7TAV7_HELPZ|nr:unnamed protein product [Heligmosomoides polygyrus]
MPSQELKGAADEAHSTSTIPVAEARSKDCRGLRGRSRGITIARDSAAIFMATGILRRPPLGSLLLFIFSTAFVFSLLIITNSFIYRYVHLCKIDHAYIYTTRKWVLVVVSINVLIVVNWIFMLLFGRSRDVAFRHEMNSVARAEAGIDLDETAFIGFSVQMNAFPLILLCENLILMFGLLLIMCFCAIQITLTLKKATLSKNAKKHHRQMFTLLLLQEHRKRY